MDFNELMEEFHEQEWGLQEILAFQTNLDNIKIQWMIEKIKEDLDATSGEAEEI